tara:strand:- start:73 stop:987 length:915 start_codon:yes stop_codon:yes gene_type:complete
MTDLTTKIKNLELDTISNVRTSKSKNTIKAYNSDFNDFKSFCAIHAQRSMPTNPKTLSLYITHLAKTCKFSTLKRRIASISVVHKLSGHYLDVKHPLVSENLLGIKRQIGTFQKSKKPILINHLKNIIDVISKETRPNIKLKNKALVLIGFAGGFRRSELVSIQYEDVEFVPEGVKIFVRRSKTDQSGEGMTKAIPYFENLSYCPVISLKNWINHSNIADGAIFKMSDKNVSLVIKKYAKLAGLDPSKYSGHSLRSGFATSTAEFGAEERSIMAMTGHKSTQMVRRYIQESNLFKQNALNKIKI